MSDGWLFDWPKVCADCSLRRALCVRGLGGFKTWVAFGGASLGMLSFIGEVDILGLATYEGAQRALHVIRIGLNG